MVEIGNTPPYRPSWPKKIDQKVTEKNSVGKEHEQQQQNRRKKSNYEGEQSGDENSHFDGYA